LLLGRPSLNSVETPTIEHVTPCSIPPTTQPRTSPISPPLNLERARFLQPVCLLCHRPDLASCTWTRLNTKAAGAIIRTRILSVLNSKQLWPIAVEWGGYSRSDNHSREDDQKLHDFDNEVDRRFGDVLRMIWYKDELAQWYYVRICYCTWNAT